MIVFRDFLHISFGVDREQGTGDREQERENIKQAQHFKTERAFEFSDVLISGSPFFLDNYRFQGIFEVRKWFSRWFEIDKLLNEDRKCREHKLF